MENMLEKEFVDYYKTYLRRDGIVSWAVLVNRAKHLMAELNEMRVAPVRGHPPFGEVKSYEIVKCGKIWVILGKVPCIFADGQREENFEMAMGIDKNELGIWWDLNSPNSSS